MQAAIAVNDACTCLFSGLLEFGRLLAHALGGRWAGFSVIWFREQLRPRLFPLLKRKKNSESTAMAPEKQTTLRSWSL